MDTERNILERFVNAPEKLPAWAFLAIVAVLAAALLIPTFYAQPSTIDDNYHYLNLGKALYQGKGYVRLDTPGHPPEDIVAPGYPILLAGVMHVTGNPKPYVGAKILSMVCYWLAVLLVTIVLIRHLKLKRWVALTLAVFMCMSRFMFFYASYILTEAPFFLFAALTVLLLFEYSRNEKPLFFWLATLTTLIAIFIRLPGAPLAIIVFTWLLFRKDYKRAIVFAVIIAFAVGTFVIPRLIEGRFQYIGQFQLKQDSVLDEAQTKSRLSRYIYNIAHYAFVGLPRIVFPQLAMYRGKLVFAESSWNEIIVGIIVGIFIIIGLIRELPKKTRNLPALYVFLYFAIVCYFVSVGIRYMFPAFPWLMFVFFMGVGYVIGLIKNKNVRIIVTALALIGLVVLAIPTYRIEVRRTARTRKVVMKKGIEPPLGMISIRRFKDEEKLHNYYLACEWARQNIPEDEVVLAGQLRTTYFYTERTTITPKYWEMKYRGRSELAERELREEEIDSMWQWVLTYDTQYILLDPVYGVVAYYTKPAIARYQNCFEEIYRTPDPATIVLKIDTLCLRRNIEGHPSQELNEFLLEVYRLKNENKGDSLGALLKAHPKSDEEVVQICKLFSYLLHMREFETLVKTFEAAREVYPKNPVLLFNWALEHNRIGLVNVSLPAFLEALEFGADSAQCYNNIAVALNQLRDYEGAEKYFAKAMEQDSNNIVTLQSRLANLIKLQDIWKADSLLGWAITRENAPEEFTAQAKQMLKTYNQWKKSAGLE